MTSQTAKYQLVTAESGDSSDMPTYTSAAMGSVEAALDRVLGQANAVSAGKVSKTGDSMSGDLLITSPNGYSKVQLMGPAGGFWFSVDPGASGATIAKLNAAGAFERGYMTFRDDGAVWIGATTSFIGEVYAPGMVASAGGGDINLNTRAVMRLSNGRLASFDKTAFALWYNLAPSTQRIKKNIKPASPEGILAVEPVTFQYRAGVVDDQGATHLGVIAEQVAEVFPAAVVHDADGKPEGVDVMALVTGLIHTVKQQQARIEALEAK